jgi:hypothetical protein
MLQLEDEGTEYTAPKLATNNFLESKPASGFVVKGAPWDPSNNEEFPSFGPSSSSDARPVNDEENASSVGNGPTVWRR